MMQKKSFENRPLNLVDKPLKIRASGVEIFFFTNQLECYQIGFKLKKRSSKMDRVYIGLLLLIFFETGPRFFFVFWGVFDMEDTMQLLKKSKRLILFEADRRNFSKRFSV